MYIGEGRKKRHGHHIYICVCVCVCVCVCKGKKRHRAIVERGVCVTNTSHHIHIYISINTCIQGQEATRGTRSHSGARRLCNRLGEMLEP